MTRFAIASLTVLSFAIASAAEIEEAELPLTVVAREGRVPHLAAAPRSGALHIVWFDSRSKDVLHAVSLDGGKTFSAPVTAISTGGRGHGAAQRGPKVGIDEKGRIFVSAAFPLDPVPKGKHGSDVCLAVSTDGGKTFGKPVRVNDVPWSAPEMYQALAVSPDGAAHLAWLDLRKQPERGQMVYTARVTLGDDGRPAAGPNVEAYVSPNGSVCECCGLGIAIAGKEGVAIAFRNSLADGTRDAYLTISRDGGKTFAASLLGQGGWKVQSCPMDAPAVGALAFPEDMMLVVAWMDRREGDANVRVMKIPGTSSIRNAEEWTLHNTSRGNQSHPALALEDRGKGTIVWEDDRPGWPAILVSASRGRNLLVTQRDEGKATFPAVAIAADSAMVAYEARGEVRLRRIPLTMLREGQKKEAR